MTWLPDIAEVLVIQKITDSMLLITKLMTQPWFERLQYVLAQITNSFDTFLYLIRLALQQITTTEQLTVLVYQEFIPSREGRLLMGMVQGMIKLGTLLEFMKIKTL